MLEENELPGRAVALIFPNCGRGEALAAGSSLAGYEIGPEQPENARCRQEAPQQTVNAARGGISAALVTRVTESALSCRAGTNPTVQLGTTWSRSIFVFS